MRSTTAYYIFSAIKYFGNGAIATLYVPLMVEDIGLSYAEVALVNAVFWFTIIAAEVPTGALADGRGRGWSVRMGSAAMAVSGFVFAFADSLAMVMFSEFMAGIAFAFFSGALNAWIVDAPDRKTEVGRVYGRETIVRGAASVIGAFVGALLAGPYGRAVGFVIYGVGGVTGFVFASLAMRGRELEHPISEFEALRKSVRHLKRSASLRWIVAVDFAAGAFVLFNLYWTPFLLTKTSQLSLGYTWAVMYGSLVVAGWALNRYTPRPGREGKAVLAALALAALPLVALRFTDPLLLVLAYFALHEAARGAFVPLMTAYADHRVKPEYRATFQSLKSFIGSIGNLAVLVTASVLLQGADPDPELVPVIWDIGGTFLLLLVASLWIWRARNGKSRALDQIKA